ncbi:SseB family protein [Amycolatopsis thermoflava]|uniref:SseB family protein n=1 Tax=Amycolatopsis thermoflava TaxID=84480 RepID=UPI00041E3FAC|nr:SseB family protein [Amycolatopsis thermoflava]
MDFEWRPANEVESGMLTALQGSDSQGFAQLLRSAPLYVPATPEPGDPWPTSLPMPEGNHVIVFTSEESLDWALGGVVDSWRRTDIAGLREIHPDHSQLVVNPGIPIGVYLVLGEVDDLAEGRQELVPVEDVQNAMVDEVLGEVRRLVLEELGGDAEAAAALQPSNPLEERLRDAVSELDFDGFLLALIGADVVVPTTEPVADQSLIESGEFPWRILGDDETPVVALFSSEGVLDVVAADSGPRVTVSFLDVLLNWPGEDHVLCFDPGTSMELTLPGTSVPELVTAIAEAAAAGGGPATGGSAAGRSPDNEAATPDE